MKLQLRHVFVLSLFFLLMGAACWAKDSSYTLLKFPLFDVLLFAVMTLVCTAMMRMAYPTIRHISDVVTREEPESQRALRLAKARAREEHQALEAHLAEDVKEPAAQRARL